MRASRISVRWPVGSVDILYMGVDVAVELSSIDGLIWWTMVFLTLSRLKIK